MTLQRTYPSSILFVITSLYRAGAQTQLVALARGLRQRGWDVHVAYLIQNDSLADELRTIGCTVECLGMQRGTPDVRAIFRLASIMKRYRPHIVHSHMIHANLLARAARLFARVPVLITTSHNTMECSRWLDAAGRLLFPLTDLHTCVSRAGVEYTIQRGAAPESSVIYLQNGLDVNRFRPDAASRERLREELGLQEKFVWLTIGRFEAQKAHHVLFEAFSQLVRERAEVELLLVGGGPLESRYRETIASLGLSSMIRMLGLRQDIPDLLNAADAFVMSSIEEGLPMVLLEAGASHLPVVATDVGGNREAMIPDQSGFLVPSNDVPALLNAMRTMTSLPPETLRAFGMAGRDHVCKHFSINAVLDKWEELYSTLTKPPRHELQRHALETEAHINAS